jgi:hypothetical protein
VRVGVLTLLCFLPGCASVEPPFASRPYQPFSRKAVVAIALREWRLFGSPVADTASGEDRRPDAAKPERQEGLWQRVGEYWWLGLDGRGDSARWTGAHAEDGHVFSPDDDGDYAWSAAFISYVMRIAGASERFPYAPNHSHYIDEAARQAKLGSSRWLILAMRPENYAPQPGDLICHGRDEAAHLRFDDLPAGYYFPAHCDVVVDVSVPGLISVVGGNVSDAVTMKHVHVTRSGLLAAPDGRLLDPDYPAMVVLKVTETK